MTTIKLLRWLGYQNVCRFRGIKQKIVSQFIFIKVIHIYNIDNILVQCVPYYILKVFNTHFRKVIGF